MHLIAMILFHNTVISNRYWMSVIFKIAAKGTKIYCFLENTFFCFGATEFRLCFLPELRVPLTAVIHTSFSYALSLTDSFFPGKPKSDCYAMTETCLFFSSLSTAGSTVSSISGLLAYVLIHQVH